jgi:O-antigen ligase
MTDRTARQLEFAGFITLVGCLGLGTFTIFGANLLVIPGVLWLILVFRGQRRVCVPPFFWPLLALAIWTLISCAFGVNPLVSFTRSRQLLFLLIVPGTITFMRGPRALTAINVLVALGAASALVGIVQYAALGYDDINHRPHGTLGHYMTYSGILMLVTCCAAARLIYVQREWIWPAIAVPALLVALVFTESRNAWVGTALAVGALAAIRNVKLLILVPIAAALFYFAAPAHVQQRMFSVIDLNDATNRDRVAMFKSGVRMVHDHPLFGVGMNNVPTMYPQYRSPDAVDPPGTVGIATRAHLHNVPIQLAAERGLPALGCWLWFVVIAFRDLVRELRRGPVKAVAGAAFSALIATLVAGLFEHNFGDSEFLLPFLIIITLPFAAKQPPAEALAPQAAIR